MALNDATLSLIAFKQLQGKSMTDINKAVGNEAEGIKLNISADAVFMDGIDNDPAIGVLLGIAEFVVADLTLDPTSNNQAYFAAYPVGHPLAGQRIINAISPTFGVGYEAKPKDGSNDPISVGDPSDWVYQYNSGIFYMQDPADVSGTPTTIELYVYTGTLLSDLASIIGDDGDWEVTSNDDLQMGVNGIVLPYADGVNDIGTLNQKFKDIFFSPTEIDNTVTDILGVNSDGKIVTTDSSSFLISVDGITIDYNTAGELTVLTLAESTTVDGITIDFNTAGELEVLDGNYLPLAGGTMTGDIVIGESSYPAPNIGIVNHTGQSFIKPIQAAYSAFSGQGTNEGTLTGFAYSFFDGFDITPFFTVGTPLRIINTQNGSNDGEFLITAIDWDGVTNWVQWAGMITETSAPYGEYTFQWEGIRFESNIIDVEGNKQASVYCAPTGTFIRLTKGAYGTPGYLNSGISIVDNFDGNVGGYFTYDGYPIVVAGQDYTIQQGVVSSVVGPGRQANVKTNYATYTENIAFNRASGGTETLFRADKTTNVDRLITLQDGDGVVAFLSDITAPLVDGITIDYNTAGELEVIDGNYLPLTGGTMTGDITMTDGLKLNNTSGDAAVTLNPNQVVFSTGTLGVDDSTYAYMGGNSISFLLSGFTSGRLGHYSMQNNDATDRTGFLGSTSYPMIFSVDNYDLKQGVGNSVIMAGSVIIAKTDNTAYTQQLGFNRASAFETILTHIDPTADRLITLQDGDGVVAFLSDITPPLVDGITIDYNTAGELEVIGIYAPEVDGITIDFNTAGELTVITEVPDSIKYQLIDDTTIKDKDMYNIWGDFIIDPGKTLTNDGRLVIVNGIFDNNGTYDEGTNGSLEIINTNLDYILGIDNKVNGQDILWTDGTGNWTSGDSTIYLNSAADNVYVTKEWVQTSIANGKAVATFTPGTLGVANTIAHTLGTADIIVQLWDVTTGAVIGGDINNATTTTVDITFTGANPSGDVKVVIL